MGKRVDLLRFARGGVVYPCLHSRHKLDDAHRNRFTLFLEQLCSNDQIRLAVRLESRSIANRHRWLVIVDTNGHSRSRFYLFGVDVTIRPSQCDRVTIGAVLTLSRESRISLDGDGGLFFLADPHIPSGTRSDTLNQNSAIGFRNRPFLENIVFWSPFTARANFKPLSIQGLWSCYQTLNRLINRSSDNVRHPLFFNIDSKYEHIVNSTRLEINEWEYDEDLWSKRPDRFLVDNGSNRPVIRISNISSFSHFNVFILKFKHIYNSNIRHCRHWD